MNVSQCQCVLQPNTLNLNNIWEALNKVYKRNQTKKGKVSKEKLIFCKFFREGGTPSPSSLRKIINSSQKFIALKLSAGGETNSI